MLKKIILYMLALLLISNANLSYAKNISLPYKDVPINAEYREWLLELYNAKVFTDDWSHMFYPNNFIKRDEAIWIISQVNCSKCLIKTLNSINDNSNNPFVDISNSNNYFNCIKSEKKEWFIKWYILWTSWRFTCNSWETFVETPFCPKNNISRIEIATILLRHMKIFDSELDNWNWKRDIVINDVDNAWYPFARKAIQLWLLKRDINNNIYPNKNAIRADFASMAIKALDINFCDISKNVEYAIIKYTEDANNYFFSVPDINPANRDFTWTASFKKKVFLTHKWEILTLPKEWLENWEYLIWVTIVNNLTWDSINWVLLLIINNSGTSIIDPNSSSSSSGSWWWSSSGSSSGWWQIDLCPLINWPESNNWCPVVDVYDNDLVIYTKNIQSCIIEQSQWNFIEISSECNTCPCWWSMWFNQKLRACDVIFAGITNKMWTKILNKWDFFNITKIYWDILNNK